MLSKQEVEQAKQRWLASAEAVDAAMTAASLAAHRHKEYPSEVRARWFAEAFGLAGYLLREERRLCDEWSVANVQYLYEPVAS